MSEQNFTNEELITDRFYADPAHPGNTLRSNIKCIGCGKLGCGTAWGPWCISCNVERIDRISGFLDNEITRYKTKE